MNFQKQGPIILLILTSFFVYQTALSQNTVSWAGAWQYGPSDAVFVDTQSELAYFGCGGAVFIADVSDPMNPQFINRDIRTKGFVRDIWYRNHMVYLACGRGGLEIWDVSDMYSPELISRSDILYFDEPTPVREIELYNDYAVLMCDWGYVHTVDISDPYNPVQLNFNGQMGNPALHIHVDVNGIIHTTGAQYYLRLIIGAGGSLTAAGQKEFLYGAGNLFGRENDAFVQYGGNMYILDLTAPGFPAWSITPVLFSDIEVRQDTAYLVNENSFQIWDVSNVQSPTLIGTAFISNGNEIYINGKHAYISSDHYGLQIIDMTDPVNPQLTGQIDALGWTANFDKSGNIGYIANASMLFAIDLSNPYGTGPEMTDILPTAGQTNDVAIDGDMAYVADWTGGLRIVDISNPSQLTEISNVPIKAWKIDAENDIVYVTDANPNYSDTLKIYNVSDPASPALLSSVTLPESSWDLEYDNGYVYISCNNSGLRIYDVADPEQPVEVSYVDLTWVLDAEIQGSLAYIAAADWDGGLVSVDISDPANPQILQIYNPEGWFQPFHVSVAAPYVYASDIYGEIYVFDATDPENMTQLATLNLPGDILNIMADGKFIYVSDGQTGLQILENNLITGIASHENPGNSASSATQIFPNPSQGAVTIKFDLPKAGYTSVNILELSGRIIKNLGNNEFSAGSHRITWDGSNSSGTQVSGGIYIYKIAHPDFHASGKIILNH